MKRRVNVEFFLLTEDGKPLSVLTIFCHLETLISVCLFLLIVSNKIRMDEEKVLVLV